MTNVLLLVVGDLPRTAATFAPTLSPVERRRASHARASTDRDRSTVAAGLLRLAAAQARGVDPAAVEVSRHCARCGTDGDHGQPVVRTGPARGVHLSATHAGDVVLAAASEEAPLGVDVEVIDLVGFPGFDEAALTPAERTAIAALPPRVQQRARARCWTRKEAILKAAGLGLSVEPTRLETMADGPPTHLPTDVRRLLPGIVTAALTGLPADLVGSIASRTEVITTLSFSTWNALSSPPLSRASTTTLSSLSTWDETAVGASLLTRGR